MPCGYILTPKWVMASEIIFQAIANPTLGGGFTQAGTPAQHPARDLLGGYDRQCAHFMLKKRSGRIHHCVKQLLYGYLELLMKRQPS